MTDTTIDIGRCTCPACTGSGPRGEEFSLDRGAGGVANGKIIFTEDEAGVNLVRSDFNWNNNNGNVLADNTINYGFFNTRLEVARNGYVNDDLTLNFDEFDEFQTFTTAQRTVARNSMELWDDLISVNLTETSADDADINMANALAGPSVQAYAYLPFGDVFDDPNDPDGFFQYGEIGGDIWIGGNVASNFNPLTDSYYATTTLIHEQGHALGLSHPGDYNASDDNDGDGVPDPITYANDALYAQDSLQYSIMSYFDGYETGAQFIDWTLTNFAYPSTPQLHDIVAVQDLYGVDTTTRTGDTTYGFNSTADRAAFNFTLNTRPIVTIWDAGGVDTLDFSGWNTPSILNLNEGAFSSGGGTVAFLTLAQVNANRAAMGFAPRSQATFDFYEGLKADLGLENGLFYDNVAIAYGAVVENATGGGGEDYLIGNGAVNVLNGGAGTDVAGWWESDAAVTASLATGIWTGGDADGDTLTSIEGLIGSRFGDSLEGDANANILEGGGGADFLNGLQGEDTLSFSMSRSGVNANLVNGDGNDTLGGIENISGSRFADTLAGNAGANEIDGYLGSDTVSYAAAAAAVTVSLASGGSAGEATGDTYISIAGIIGSAFGDRLTGDGANNTIAGGLGGDTIDGAGGTDFVSYASATVAVSVNLTTGIEGGVRGDRLSNIEGVIGSNLADRIGGSANDDILLGGGGGDTIIASGGDDEVEGGAGNDNIRGGVGFDIIFGDDGNDTLLGENDDDEIDGGVGDDSADGGNGDDILSGGTGSDTLKGGAGDDLIYTDAGADRLTGGAGDDLFVIDFVETSDTILDFTQGEDALFLQFVDANRNAAGDQAFSFIGAGAFTNVAGQLRAYADGGDIIVAGDTNGDGIADLIITLRDLGSFGATDILVL